MNKALLDTDTMSLLMRRDQRVVSHAKSYLDHFPNLSFSAITRYEILRGLKAKKATVQLAAFEIFCDANEVVSVTDEIIIVASDIYADLYNKGNLVGDADILIAATAISQNLILATNNARHFSRIVGLSLENWTT